VRVGLIAPPWVAVPPPGYGGTESVVDNLARGLTDLGHRVELFTVGESTSPVARRHLFEHAVEPMGLAVPEAAHVLAAYESLTDVDVIHDHTVLGPLVAGRAGIARVPVVTTSHGVFTPVTRRIYAEIARTASVVAISHDQARRARVPIAAVIHHGVDLDAFRWGPGDGDYVAFVGRMSPEKGVHTAVAIARAAGRRLRIATKMRDPGEVEYFEAKVRPLLHPDVDLALEVPLGERVELMRRATALLNPIAWDEPFGLVSAESLACGTPVVTSPRGAAPEIVRPGRTGFLCPTEESAVEALDAVRFLSREECRRDVEERFSIRRMARDHVALYQRLLADVPHGRPGFARAADGGPVHPGMASAR
jgi:glycosyltransferase involved in cell wall biosynthesis